MERASEQLHHRSTHQHHGADGGCESVVSGDPVVGLPVLGCSAGATTTGAALNTAGAAGGPAPPGPHGVAAAAMAAARVSPLLKPAPRAAGSGPSPGPLPRVVGRAPRPSHASGHSIELCGVTVFIPRTSILVRVLAAAIALLIFIQAVSCGAFFCVALPFHHHHATTYVDVRDIVSDAPVLGVNAPPDAAAAAAGLPSHGAAALVSTPKLIPRVIHQTYRSKRFPSGVRPLVRSWRAVNGDAWEVRFYDDVAAMNFVRREFPEYLEAYLALPKDVERADFFKYMVVLRMGGAYADIDTECRQPLDGIISPIDTLVVGWDAEVPDHAAAGRRLMARQRQLLPWFFAAAPGHPALRELCDRVARNAHQAFSNSSVRDTQERTGQGVWTDVVLRHATNGMTAKASDPWRVRILPRIAFGVNPAGHDGLTADLSDVVVLHHFLGSWETKAPGWGWGWGLGGGAAGGAAVASGGGARRSAPHRKALQILSPLVPASWVHDAEADAAAAAAEPPRPAAAPLFPVSAAFDPPFTVMTHLAGEGDAGGGGEDVSAEITRFGGYQPGLLPTRRPSLVEALVGSLGPGTIRAGQRHMPPGTVAAGGSGGAAAAGAGASAAAAATAAAAAAAAGTAPSQGARGASPGVAPGDEASRGVFVDVGAGEGFFSLAAAARGHHVLAFESSQLSLEALKAGIAYNGFESLVQVVSNVTLGPRSEVLCVPEVLSAAEEQQWDQQQQQEGRQDKKGQQTQPTAGNSSRKKGGSAEQQQGQQQQQQQLMRRRRMERRLREDATRTRRGYVSAPSAAAAGSAASTTAAASAARCPKGTRAARRAALSDVLGKRTDVATLRISAHGHEGWVLEGLVPYLKAVHRPHVIYVEFSPAAMRAAGWDNPASLVETMRGLGYADAAHAGRVCDARWGNVTAALRSGGSFSPTAQLAYHQPTWCKLRADSLALLIEGAEDAPAPENILFILNPSAAAGGGAAAVAAAGTGGAAAAQGAAAAAGVTAAAGTGAVARERGGTSA